MKKQRKRLLALILAWTVALSGCTAPAGETETSPAPTIRPTATPAPVAEGVGFALPCSPSAGFHPITGANRLNLTLAPLLYRGLFALDRRFQVQNDLCESYTVSEDGLTWTFTLAEAAFSDGHPLTAAEAAASLNLARQSDRYGARLSDVIRVSGREGNTVTVTLSRPNGALPALLDVPIVKETDDPLRPLGTGAYVLEENDDGLYLSAREGAGVPLETIPLRSVGASDDLVYAFDAGEISLVDTDPLGTNMPGYSGRLETTDYPTTGLLYVGCNAKSGACEDPAVRRALALAWDRQEIVAQLLSGHAVASALPIHPYAPDYAPQAAAVLGYDREGAAALLAQAGWSPDEEGRLQKRRSQLTLRLVVNQENTFKVTVAAALAQALEELGCVVTVDKLPWEDFAAALERGNFDLYLGETVLTADFDPQVLLGTQGALNYGGYESRETDELIDGYRAARGEERKAAAAALWTRLGEDSPIICLCFKNGSLLTQWGQVSGVTPTQRNLFYGLESWSVGR